MAGKDLDAVIISQVYHTLSSPAQFAAVRAALHDEDGTLGMLWSRALEGSVRSRSCGCVLVRCAWECISASRSMRAALRHCACVGMTACTCGAWDDDLKEVFFFPHANRR